MDALPIWQLTVEQLRGVIQSEFRRSRVSQEPGAAPCEEMSGDAAKIEREIAESNQRAQEKWSAALTATEVVGASPTDIQICFLKDLIDLPEESKKFLEDPKRYAIEHGVLLDPALVRDIIAVVAFGEDLGKLSDRLSLGALRDVASMRDHPQPCVVTQGAAAVVVGAVSPSSAQEVMRLKGLGPEGVRLPGGRTLRFPADFKSATLVASTAVAVYGATTVALLSNTRPVRRG